MRFTVLTTGDIQKIHETALHLLQSVGMAIPGESVGRVLRAAGARERNGRFVFEPKKVEEALAQVPKDGFSVSGRDLGRGFRVAAGAVRFRPAGGLPFVFDPKTLRRRPATMRDAEIVVKVIDGLPNIDVVNCAVSPPDIGVGIRNVRRFAVSIMGSSKPTDITASGPDEVRAVADIARVFRSSDRELQENPPVIVYVSPTSPMRLSEEEALATVECARQGLPLAPLSCPSLAATAPVTVAGGVAQEWAEELAQIVLAYAVHPGLPVVACNRINPIDMRRGNTIFSGAVPCLSAAAFTEVAAHFGVPANSWGFSTSSHVPDLQAGAERMLGAFVAAAAGTAVISGAGALGNALIASPEQLAIDDEIASLARSTIAGVEVNRETLAIDFLEQGIAEGTYLSSEHTINVLQAGGLWSADLLAADPYETWAEAGVGIVERAEARVQEIVGSPESGMVDKAAISEVGRILEAAGAL